MPVQVIGNTQASAWLPTIWAQELALELKANFVLAKTVNRNYSNEVAQRGTTVSVPVPPTFSAYDVVGDSGTSNVTLTAVNVPLNKWKHVTVSVQDVAAVQSQPQVLTSVVRSMATALAEAVERDLFSLYTAASANVGTAGTAVTSTTIRQALQKLDENRVPTSGRYVVLSPKDVHALLGDSSLAPYFAYNQTTVRTGEIGTLYGATIAMSQLVPVVSGNPPTTYNLAYHQDAIVLVSRPLPAPQSGSTTAAIVSDDALGISFRLMLDYDVVQKSHIISVDLLYGVAVTRPEGVIQVRS